MTTLETTSSSAAMQTARKFKVTVVGSGYVGMSLAALLARDSEIVVLDIDADRVDQINNYQSTVADPDIEQLLQEKELFQQPRQNQRLSWGRFCSLCRDSD